MSLLLRRIAGYATCNGVRLTLCWKTLSPVQQLCGRTFTDMAKRYMRSKNSLYYLGSVGVVFFSFAILSVPAYRMFCEKTTITGLTKVADDLERVASMQKVENRLIRVSFNADLDSSMKWEFKPQQSEIYVHPGETALVFYSARNPTDKPVVGISTYNLTPFQAAYYFNKIQCFCFEDQILNPGEQVDLPVFFYIDPDYVNDPDLEYTDNLLLSYTFFESKSDLVLPDPFDPDNRPAIKRNANVTKSEGKGSEVPESTVPKEMKTDGKK